MGRELTVFWDLEKGSKCKIGDQMGTEAWGSELGVRNRTLLAVVLVSSWPQSAFALEWTGASILEHQLV